MAMDDSEVRELRVLLLGVRSRMGALEVGVGLLQNEDATAQQKEWVVDMVLRSIDDINNRLIAIDNLTERSVELPF